MAMMAMTTSSSISVKALGRVLRRSMGEASVTGRKSPASEKPWLEFDQTENPFREHLLATPQTMGTDGWFDIPTGPGLGVEVDEAFVARYAVDPAKAPVHTAYGAPKTPAGATA